MENNRKWGMKVSVTKTEKLVIGDDQQSIVLEVGRKIQDCEEYNVWLTKDRKLDRAIEESECIK